MHVKAVRRPHQEDLREADDPVETGPDLLVTNTPSHWPRMTSAPWGGRSRNVGIRDDHPGHSTGRGTERSSHREANSARPEREVVGEVLGGGQVSSARIIVPSPVGLVAIEGIAEQSDGLAARSTRPSGRAGGGGATQPSIAVLYPVSRFTAGGRGRREAERRGLGRRGSHVIENRTEGIERGQGGAEPWREGRADSSVAFAGARTSSCAACASSRAACASSNRCSGLGGDRAVTKIAVWSTRARARGRATPKLFPRDVPGAREPFARLSAGLPCREHGRPRRLHVRVLDRDGRSGSGFSTRFIVRLPSTARFRRSGPVARRDADDARGASAGAAGAAGSHRQRRPDARPVP